MDYKPLFPYFGGKSKVADLVWSRFGDVANYIEPFFGSGAMMFLRPKMGGVETVNDKDCLLVNLWRAVQGDPAAVAHYADNPVHEVSLHARHLWLISQKESLTERMIADMDFFDAKIAGWWVWGLCCWIGSGWCSGDGPWSIVDGAFVKAFGSKNGVNRQRPHLGDAGVGVNRQRPHLSSNGMGVVNGGEATQELIGWFSSRLRNVRVTCGDWSRITGHSVTTGFGVTAVFLDPPYPFEAGRDNALYREESGTVAHDVAKWAIEQGDNPLMRIAFCGYEGSHSFPDTWTVVAWKSGGGYGNRGDDKNATRERIWFSPHCVPERKYLLFPESEDG